MPLGTLTDLDSSCPGSLLKTTPPPPGYPWVSRGRYVTPEPRFRGLVLDHQLLKEPEPKNHSKRAKLDQKEQFSGGFLALPPLNLDGRQKYWYDFRGCFRGQRLEVRQLSLKIRKTYSA